MQSAVRAKLSSGTTYTKGMLLHGVSQKNCPERSLVEDHLPRVSLFTKSHGGASRLSYLKLHKSGVRRQTAGMQLGLPASQQNPLLVWAWWHFRARNQVYALTTRTSQAESGLRSHNSDKPGGIRFRVSGSGLIPDAAPRNINFRK